MGGECPNCVRRIRQVSAEDESHESCEKVVDDLIARRHREKAEMDERYPAASPNGPLPLAEETVNPRFDRRGGSLPLQHLIESLHVALLVEPSLASSAGVVVQR